MNPFQHFCTQNYHFVRSCFGEFHMFILPPEIPKLFHRRRLSLFPSVNVKREENFFFSGTYPILKRKKMSAYLSTIPLPRLKKTKTTFHQSQTTLETRTWSFLFLRIFGGGAMDWQMPIDIEASEHLQTCFFPQAWLHFCCSQIRKWSKKREAIKSGLMKRWDCFRSICRGGNSAGCWKHPSLWMRSQRAGGHKWTHGEANSWKAQKKSHQTDLEKKNLKLWHAVKTQTTLRTRDFCTDQCWELVEINVPRDVGTRTASRDNFFHHLPL